MKACPQFCCAAFTLALLLSASDARSNTYQIVIDVNSWTTAKADAESRGGHLATVTSAAEWAEIDAQIGEIPMQMWLGANDLDSEGDWQWITGEPWVYVNWVPGEPSQVGIYGEEDYLIVNDVGGGWNDGVELHPFRAGYILEFETGVVPEAGHMMTGLSLGAGVIWTLRRRPFRGRSSRH